VFLSQLSQGSLAPARYVPIWIDEVAPRVPGVEQYRDLECSGLKLVCMRATAMCECISLLMHYRISVH
jgi:hypothetical protein